MKYLIPVALFLVILALPVAYGEEYVEVLNVDRYVKSVNVGETVQYTWTVQNIDLKLNRNYTVRIEVMDVPRNWDVKIEPEEIPVMNVSDARTITLTLTSRTDEVRSANVTVVFYVLWNNTLINRIEKNALTKLILPPSLNVRVVGLFDNPLPPPLDNEIGVFILNIIAWFFISIFVIFIFFPIIRRIFEKTETKLDDIILDIIKYPVIILVFLYGFVNSLTVLHKYIPLWLILRLIQFYDTVVFLVGLYIAYKIFRDIIIHYGKKIAQKTSSKVDDVIIPIFEKVFMIIIGIVALGYVLKYMGFDLTAFIAGGVVISMMIAFAAQESLSNIISGIFMSLDRPFKEGDIVILSDGDWCEVRKIGLRTTRLFRFSDASEISIPNNKLVNEKIANFTSPVDKGRVMKTFNVAYGSEPEKVKKIISEVINSCEYIIRDDPNLKPIVRFEEMADSSINFFILVWIGDRAKRFDVGDYLNTNVYRRFYDEGIEIPFPQRVVHIKQEEKK